MSMINDQFMNQLFVFPISDRLEKCIPEMGDDTLTYEENGYYVFERNGQCYVVPERDVNGNWKKVFDMDLFRVLYFIYGDEFMMYSELPEQIAEAEK